VPPWPTEIPRQTVRNTVLAQFGQRLTW
jgi:hypothetical protein